MLSCTRLGPQRKAIVCEKDIDQALRSTFPHCLASSKEFVHLIDAQDDWQEGEETLAMEFKAVNSEEDPGLHDEQVISLSSHLERVETEHLIDTIGQIFQFQLSVITSSKPGEDMMLFPV